MRFLDKWLGKANETLPRVQELADTDLQLIIMDALRKLKTADEKTINDIIENETSKRIDVHKLVRILDVLNILGLISIRIDPIDGRQYELVPRGTLESY